MTALDMRYGRQGGRVVPFVAGNTVMCRVCGSRTVNPAGVHEGCRGQLSLLDGVQLALFSDE